MVAKFKTERLAKPNPNDSGSGTLSVDTNMVNDSPLSHWWRVYGSKI